MCGLCNDDKYFSETGLGLHFRKNHKKYDPKKLTNDDYCETIFKCEKCPQTFSNFFQIRDHILFKNH